MVKKQSHEMMGEAVHWPSARQMLPVAPGGFPTAVGLTLETGGEEELKG